MDQDWTSLRIRQATRERMRSFASRARFTYRDQNHPERSVRVPDASADDVLNLMLDRLEGEHRRKSEAARKSRAGAKPAA
jgi:hypothetical protein